MYGGVVTRVWWVVASATSLASIVLTLMVSTSLPAGYGTIAALPIAFFVAHVGLLGPLLVAHPSSFTLWALALFSWLRYVVSPSAHVWGATLPIDTADAATIPITICAMVAELVVLVVVARLLYPDNRPRPVMPHLQLDGWIPAYVGFGAVVAALFLLRPSSLRLFSFFVVRADSPDRVGSEGDTQTMLFVYLAKVAILVLAFSAIEWARRRYVKGRRLMDFLIACVPAMLVIMVIVGERRSEQIYLAMAMCWLLVALFPDRRSIILRVVGGVGFAVVALMSVYKFLYAFAYGSYAQAIANAKIDIPGIAVTLDNYFYGLATTATNLQFVMHANLGWSQLGFDFARSTFGPSFLVRDTGNTTSQLFNQALYAGSQSSGYLFSGAAYGFIFLGLVGAPLFGVIKLLLLAYAEARLWSARGYESTFLWIYTVGALCFTFYGALVMQMSTLSTTWVMFGIAFLAATAARQFTRRRHQPRHAKGTVSE